MRFSVRHETLYRYSSHVRLGDQTLRLRPYNVLLHDHRYEVTPEPSAREDHLSDFGTPVTRLSFNTPTDELRIISRFCCDTRPPPEASDLPLLPWSFQRMEPYLGTGEEESVSAFARRRLSESGAPLPFLYRLTEDLYARTRRHIRPVGYAQSAGETLASASGACRDLAVLFISACRSLGMPARFVSGYQAKAESVDGKRHLHAWPEVYLPGVGWKGFDPTHGIAVSDGHVALSAAPDQAGTMPLEGGFWGDGVTSELTFKLEIEAG
ncbi:transglutaminase family protein [Celeribacter sp. ULVN23_4]